MAAPLFFKVQIDGIYLCREGEPDLLVPGAIYVPANNRVNVSALPVVFAIDGITFPNAKSARRDNGVIKLTMDNDFETTAAILLRIAEARGDTQVCNVTGAEVQAAIQQFLALR